MESALEEQLDKALEVPNVVGVIAADTQGLCLGHRGEGKPELSGQVASLCQSANMLIKNPQDIPVIMIETNDGKTRSMMIKQIDDVCTAVILDSSSLRS